MIFSKKERKVAISYSCGYMDPDRREIGTPLTFTSYPEQKTSRWVTSTWACGWMITQCSHNAKGPKKWPGAGDNIIVSHQAWDHDFPLLWARGRWWKLTVDQLSRLKSVGLWCSCAEMNRERLRSANTNAIHLITGVSHSLALPLPVWLLGSICL